ncbi:hypothetical protein HDE_04905 [Halotydeus destructor]|nr:hypothetical protein HDE_04905 [Halotydeus destructor]
MIVLSRCARWYASKASIAARMTSVRKTCEANYSVVRTEMAAKVKLVQNKATTQRFMSSNDDSDEDKQEEKKQLTIEERIVNLEKRGDVIWKVMLVLLWATGIIEFFIISDLVKTERALIDTNMRLVELTKIVRAMKIAEGNEPHDGEHEDEQRPLTF